MAARYHGKGYSKYPKSSYSTSRPGAYKDKKVDKEEINMYVSEKTYRMGSCVAFDTFWKGNFRLLVVADVYYGFTYSNPPIIAIWWRRAKDICRHLYDRLSAGEDKAPFATADYLGQLSSPFENLFIDSRKDMLKLLDWGRTITGSDSLRAKISAIIQALRQETIKPHEALDEVCVMIPPECDITNELTGMTVKSCIYPFNVWSLADAHATVGDFSLAGMQRPWNATLTIEEQRTPVTFDQEPDQRAEAEFRRRNEEQRAQAILQMQAFQQRVIAGQQC
jgi:hypothetical protein